MTDDQKKEVKEKFTKAMIKVVTSNDTTDLIADDKLVNFYIENVIGSWDNIYKDFEEGLKNNETIDEQIEIYEQVIKAQSKINRE